MSKIKLFAEPHVAPRTWRDFIKNAPKYSIALDGYVADESKFDADRCVANFNHHEKVNRLATRATCAQILMAIRMNLFDYFRDANNEINLNIFVNDCDEDVCLSYFLLKYGYMAEYTINPNLNRLVSLEDYMDATSGAYPYPKDAPVLRELAWIFEPYYRARYNGLLRHKTPEICAGIITDVESRILRYLMGKGEELPLDTRYTVVGGGKGWAMVEEQGIHARTGMRSDGINTFLSVTQRDADTYSYVLGKTSPYVRTLDLDKLYRVLNGIECLTGDMWGGSDIIGGSPRVGGSKLTPKDLERIINEHLI